MIRIRFFPFLAVALLFVSACEGGREPEATSASTPDIEADVVRPGPPEGSPAPSRPRVLFIGTSLTEGYGLASPQVEAWPHRLQSLADSAGLQVEVMNAGLAGETSAGALRRLEWVLRAPADVIVLETGANDGLRGLPVEALEANLDSIIVRIRRAAPLARVLLIGMEAPPNLGEAYVTAFRDVYPRVASRREVDFLPFERFLGEVAGNPALNQEDGIHPNATGHRRMAEGSWTVLAPILRDIQSPDNPSTGAPELP